MCGDVGLPQPAVLVLKEYKPWPFPFRQVCQQWLNCPVLEPFDIDFQEVNAGVHIVWKELRKWTNLHHDVAAIFKGLIQPCLPEVVVVGQEKLHLTRFIRDGTVMNCNIANIIQLKIMDKPRAHFRIGLKRMNTRLGSPCGSKPYGKRSGIGTYVKGGKGSISQLR